jgi:hypothetical protein
MNPGALLADVCDFNHVGVEACCSSGLAERCFVHTRRAGTYNDAGESVIFDRVLNEVLTCFGAHIRIFGGENDAGFFTECFSDSLNVYGAGNIRAAMAHKYTNLLHFVSPPLFLILAECAHEELTGGIVFDHTGDVFRFEMIFALTANSHSENRFHDLRRADVTGTTFRANGTAKTFVNGRRIYELFDFALLYHIYKLMRMIFHLIVRRTSTGAFAASHTFENIHAA